jgi:hypothetical protein
MAVDGSLVSSAVLFEVIWSRYTPLETLNDTRKSISDRSRRIPVSYREPYVVLFTDIVQTDLVRPKIYAIYLEASSEVIPKNPIGSSCMNRRGQISIWLRLVDNPLLIQAKPLAITSVEEPSASHLEHADDADLAIHHCAQRVVNRSHVNGIPPSET